MKRTTSLGQLHLRALAYATILVVSPSLTRASDLPDMSAVFADSVASVVTGSGDDAADEIKQQVGGSILDWFEREVTKRGEDKGVEPSSVPQKPRKSEWKEGASPDRKGPLSGIQAGLAFEIHVAGADGREQAVDPTSHVFQTGDRFRVYFRPSLPGRVIVVNVNPLGVAKEIDNARLPAGELLMLGPYQFVAEKGVERLRLTLQPCGDPALLMATRDIVRVEAQDASQPALIMISSDQLEFSASGTGTRDIRKVEVQGKTGYALDPVADAELVSGALAPRSVEITLLHQ